MVTKTNKGGAVALERASIEVFERGDKQYFLAITPPGCVKAVHNYLQQQPDEVSVRPADVVGDLAVNLLNGKSLEQVVGQVGMITGWHGREDASA